MICNVDSKLNDSNDVIYGCLDRQYDSRFDNNITEQSTKCSTIERIPINNHIYTNDLIKEQTITNIYRYKFTDIFMNELAIFSKIHQYDDRKEFKEAWEEWIRDNNDIVSQEIRRLNQSGFVGNPEDKMFKSARYYFRKKTNEKKEPKKRRQYISVNKELLETMDLHIQENPNLQPKIGFLHFCQEYEDIIKEELAKIIENGITDINLIRDKIKKTYKNRYFRFFKNNN
jgi:hypothetical protein